MKKNVAVKTKKELERRFGKMAESMTEYEEHIDFRSWEDFDDEAFAFVMQNVKGVNMLDLNETDITNDSIRLLTGLEYVHELRAKECRHLDDGCADDLNKLTSLVFLHLKSTNITIDGLLKLTNLSNLKTLMFSADDIEWVDINPIEKGIGGEAGKTKEQDHSTAIIKLLENLEFPFMITDGIISAYVLKMEI